MPEHAPHKHQRLAKLERAWQDVLPAITLVIAMWAVIINGNQVSRAEVRIDQQAVGRQAAIGVLCGFANGVSQAGRKVIISSDVEPERFKQNLLELGMYPDDQRRDRSEQAARLYVQLVTNSVIEQVGMKAGLVKDDGTLDCERLSYVARARTRNTGG